MSERTESRPNIVEREPGQPLPAITTIVRHGSTDYKELRDPSFQFDPAAAKEHPDAEHLDLNDKGIAEIRETAEQLVRTIDKDREVVLLVSSPNFRARSSELLIEERLRQAGIEVLNPNDEVYIANNLRQISYREDMRSTWIEADKRFRHQDPSHTRMTPERAHALIAASLGKEITDIFTEDYRGISGRFHRYLRHMTNIERMLSDETKGRLYGKRIRVVSLTHEELPAVFLRETFGMEENMRRGQILEIDPSGTLGKDNEVSATVTLHEKGPDAPRKTAEVILPYTR
ncbi:MAG: hypothetical protein V1907_03640 [Candidatus Kerfeldbacteria bacterium]